MNTVLTDIFTLGVFVVTLTIVAMLWWGEMTKITSDKPMRPKVLFAKFVVSLVILAASSLLMTHSTRVTTGVYFKDVPSVTKQVPPITRDDRSYDGKWYEQYQESTKKSEAEQNMRLYDNDSVGRN